MRAILTILTIIFITSCSKKDGIENSTWVYSDNHGSSELFIGEANIIANTNWYDTPKADTAKYSFKDNIISTCLFGDSIELKLNGDTLSTIAEYPLVFIRKK